MFWYTTRYRIDLGRARVMGIVNLTPDSFSDGGHLDGPLSALKRCEQLLAEGADILDIGGESSRPGALPLTVDEEWARVRDVLRSAVTLGVPVSIDTCKAEVMQRALDVGVDIINDIHALTAPGAEDVVVSHGHCGVCLMHMRGTPLTMQAQANYEDVVEEVKACLSERSTHLTGARGMVPDRIVLDPGIGFGKTPEHNLALLRRQAELLNLGHGLLVGWSRKSTLGVLTGKPTGERMPASVAAALASVTLGARVVRVHDVAATVDALKVWHAAGLDAGTAR